MLYLWGHAAVDAVDAVDAASAGLVIVRDRLLHYKMVKNGCMLPSSFYICAFYYFVRC